MNSVRMLLDYWFQRNLWSIAGLMIAFALTQFNYALYTLFYIALILFIMNSCVTYLGGHLLSVPQNSYIDMLPVTRRAYFGVFVTMTCLACLVSGSITFAGILGNPTGDTAYSMGQMMIVISCFVLVGLEGILLYFIDMEKRANRELLYSVVVTAILTLQLAVFPIHRILQNNYLYWIGLLLNVGMILIILAQFIQERYFNKQIKENINPILDLGSIYSEEKNTLEWYHRFIYGFMIVLTFFSAMAMDSYLITGMLTFCSMIMYHARTMGQDRTMLNLLPVPANKLLRPYLEKLVELISAGIIGCNILYFIQFLSNNSFVFLRQFNPIEMAFLVVISGYLMFSFEVFLQQYRGTMQVFLRAIGIFINAVIVPSTMLSLQNWPYQVAFSGIIILIAYLIVKMNVKKIWNI